MTDCKGNPVKVGDRVYVTPECGIGGNGIVRWTDDKIAWIRSTDKRRSWSVWCRSGEFELMRGKR